MKENKPKDQITKEKSSQYLNKIKAKCNKRKKQASSKVKKQKQNFTIETIKAEMIKDLKFHNLNTKDATIEKDEINRNKLSQP